MKISLFRKGFTLIELLVVIAIIGILTAIITTNFTTAKSKARDAKRVSDIAQLQLTLEQFFDRCGNYPIRVFDSDAINTIQSCSSNPSGVALNNFISVIPRDPLPAVSYEYGLASSNLDYVLKATFENPIPSSIDSVDSSSIYSINCTKTSKYYCVQPK